MHGEVRQRFQSANVNVLSLSNVRVERTWLYQRGEITNAVDRETGQNLKAQFRKVDPFVRGVLGSSVIEIEAIDVYVCPDCLNEKNSLPKKQSRLAAARALAPKIEGV